MRRERGGHVGLSRLARSQQYFGRAEEGGREEGEWVLGGMGRTGEWRDKTETGL